MDIQNLQEKLVAVLGFGQEGRAVTDYLIKHGIRPVLFDEKPWGDWNEQDRQYIRNLGLNVIFDPDWIKEFKGFDVAFRSPGISLSKLDDIKLVNRNLIITSQTKWFFEHCPARIIGVTGTKGKGTTSSLIYEILQRQSEISNEKSEIYLTGNIGKEQPLDFLDNLKPEDWVTYELSSFQLQDLDRSPHIGVVLMVTREHLDYHKDVNEYICAKEAIVKYQTPEDTAIINADFESSLKIGNKGSGKKQYFSLQKPADCYLENTKIYCKSNTQTAVEVFDASQLQLKGRHNLENVCAAILASQAAGCDFNAIRQAVADFKGLEHRLEFVAEKRGIKFYDDSFSTTPETAIAAINSFLEPLILILGGSSKKSDFTELGKVIVDTKNIKAIILIGQEADRIKQAIDQAGQFKEKLLEGAKSMPEIFKEIKSIALPGDAVVLSPACASFGLFSDYKDRGEQFKEAVNGF